MAQLTFGGPLALLAAPFINRREQQRERETQDLIKRAYTGDQEALLQLATKNPALLTGIVKMKEAQQQQQAADEFQNALKGVTVPGGMRLGNVPKLSMAPLGAGLDMQGLLTGASPAQPPVMPEITQGAPYTRPPTDEEIRQAILQRLGATGNFSELSGVKSLSEALTEDEKRRQLTGDYDMRNALIGEITPRTQPAQVPTGEQFGQWMLGGGQFPQIQQERTVYPGPEQYANVQARGGLLANKPGEVMAGQYDLARIGKIERGEEGTSDFTRKVAYLESIGKTPDEIVTLVYKPATKDGSEKFTKDVQEFYEVTGKPPANLQEFLGYLKQREAATRKETPDKDVDLLKEYYAYNLKQMGGGSEFYHPTTGQLLMKSGGVLPKLTFEQFKQWRMTGEMPQPTGQTPAPSQPAQGTVKPRTAMDFLKSKGLMR